MKWNAGKQKRGWPLPTFKRLATNNQPLQEREELFFEPFAPVFWSSFSKSLKLSQSSFGLNSDPFIAMRYERVTSA